MFRFSWKWRRRSPIKLMERTHEEATEAIRAGREGRHSEAALAGEGAHLEVVRRSGAPADGLLPLAEGILRERGCWDLGPARYAGSDRGFRPALVREDRDRRRAFH